MALFKVLRGNRSNLDSFDIVPFHDGYAYFCADTGEFFIDCETDKGNQRIQVKGAYQPQTSVQILDWESVNSGGSDI